MGHEHFLLVLVALLIGAYVGLDIRRLFGGHGLGSAGLRC